MMGVSIAIICIITGSASLMCVSGNNRGPVVKCNNTPVKLTAHPGGSVTIQCEYPRADTINLRRFCREVKNSDCTDLISAMKANVTIKSRYSLEDNKQKGVFTVVISDLTLEDDGRYRCEVERVEDESIACSTKIQLQIVDWDDITPTEKKEASGKSVRIDCNYPKSHEKNEKFLCKGKTPFICENLIQTTNEERDVEKGKFKIRDNQRLNSFFVHISDLSTDDSGTYWCGSARPRQQAEFNKTLLTVVDKKHIKTRRSGRPTETDHSDSEEVSSDEGELTQRSEGWIGGVVVGVLLLILLVVLVLFRRKLPRSQVCCAGRGSSVQVTNAGQNTEGNHEEPDYAEIQDQQASSGHVLRTISATIDPPADQLHYASVNTHKDSVSVSTGKDALPNINHCDYASVMTQSPVHPPGTERTVYSTLSMPGEP